MIIRELLAAIGMDVDPSGFDKGEAAIDKVKRAMGRLGELAAAAAVGLAAIVGATAEAGEGAALAAQRLGLTTDAVQELRFAAAQSGISAEELDHSLMLLARSAVGAAEGSEEVARAYHQLGIRTREPNGQFRAADELLEDLADKFSKLPANVDRGNLAMRIFGRSGAELLPLLLKGKDGIDALRQSAHDYGVVLDAETIAQAREFTESSRLAMAAVKGLAYAIGGPLLQVFGPLIQSFAKWVALHRQEIATGVLDDIQGIGHALLIAYHAVGPLLKVMGKLLANETALKVVTWAVVGALGAFAAYMLVDAVVSVFAFLGGIASLIAGLIAFTAATGGAGAAVEAITGILAASPYVIAAAWLAVLALVALVIEDIYYFFTGRDSLVGRWNKQFNEWWLKAKDQLKTAFSELWDWLVDTAEDAGRRAAVAVKDGLMNVARNHPVVAQGLAAALDAVVPGAGVLALRAVQAQGGDATDGGTPRPTPRLGGGTLLDQVIAGAPPTALFGGGSSPAATAAQASPAPNVAVSVDASMGDITITVPPGSDPEELKRQVRELHDEQHDRIMRETAAAVGG